MDTLSAEFPHIIFSQNPKVSSKDLKHRMPPGDTDFFIAMPNTNCTVNLTYFILCVRNLGCRGDTKLKRII